MKLALFAFAVLAGPALADDYVPFHSPSGNIQCAIVTGDFAQVRCDMAELTPSFTRQPNSREFDWGFSFAVELDSRKGYLACVSDAVADPGGLELGYGKQIDLGGFICISEKSGMTCTNPAGHGFAISKAKQRVF